MFPAINDALGHLVEDLILMIMNAADLLEDTVLDVREVGATETGAPLAVATTTTTAEDIALHQELVAPLTTTRLPAADLRIPTVATTPLIHI
jgi:hypothetical protein